MKLRQRTGRKRLLSAIVIGSGGETQNRAGPLTVHLRILAPEPEANVRKDDCNAAGCARDGSSSNRAIVPRTVAVEKVKPSMQINERIVFWEGACGR